MPTTSLANVLNPDGSIANEVPLIIPAGISQEPFADAFSEVMLENPIVIERVVQEKRAVIVKSYTIRDIIEKVQLQTVRVLIALDDGSLVWLTAFSGDEYQKNFDYSQADLESAIASELKAGRFEG